MAGPVAGGGGGDTPVVRRSWFPRTVAAVFLGAGVYAGLAVVGQAVAHADEPAATSTQAEQTQPSDPTATAPATDATAQQPAGQTASDTTTVSTSATTVDSTGSPGTATTTDSSQTTSPTTGTPGAASDSKTQTTTTPTATVTTANAAGAVSQTAPAAATATPPATASVVPAPAPVVPAATPAQPAASITAASPVTCVPTGLTATQAAGSATHNRPVAAAATKPSAGAAPAAGAGTTPVAPTTFSGATPAGTPLAPEYPQQLPSPTTVAAFGGCGDPGAGEGSPKGSAAPTTAGVLVPVIDIPAVQAGSAPEAPVAGSPASSANDPATRPA